MSRGPSTFRQRDLAAAVKAMRSAGVEVSRVEVSKDGKITVIAAQSNAAEPAAEPRGERNAWDAI